jgi:hydrogenase expression/formation protein HypE
MFNLLPLQVMMNDEKTIRLSHGNGGSLMHDLIEKVFLPRFGNRFLLQRSDSAILPAPGEEIAFTTDSFVVDPLFFPGGDIGKLAVCGTVNDLAVSGARPKYLSLAMVIEEGLPFADLERICDSIAAEAKKAGVTIVTGDTKVVPAGKGDKIFITTTGIGIRNKKHREIGKLSSIRPGDAIIINGTIGDHGMAVLNARESFAFMMEVVSDCAPLQGIIHSVLRGSSGVRFMRDPTRGGLAAMMNELVSLMPYGIVLREEDIPLSEGVRGLCEILGFDPLYVANEGKVVMVAAAGEAEDIVKKMRRHPLGRRAAVIGNISAAGQGKVVLETMPGGRRILPMPIGDQLPRIC